ncbi:MAG: glycosyltransferase [Saprospirales bacterium]|nr:glycosyltransferase [Saprospirales bacterium]MBK8490511.1 glycosyltransferase [Saprospirales bacterium]
METPSVSIITVVFNARELLEGTMRSVFGQTYPSIEYIVVDGGSTDGTVALIQAHAGRIAHWISEPDKGIYDAMNKGLRLATGDFVWFLNAGDELFSSDIVEKAMAFYRPETDILYGEVMLVDDQRRHLGIRTELTAQKLPALLTWKSLRFGMVVCHQAILVRRIIAPFFIENNLTADIDWVICALRHSRETRHTSLVLAEYLQGGLSKKRHRRSLKDRYIVLRKHYGFWENLLAHAGILLRALWHRFRRLGKAHY